MSAGKNVLYLAKETAEQTLLKKGVSAFAFLEPTDEEKALLPEAKSILVALFPYYAGDEPSKTRANLSLYCRGKDYHVVAPAILEEAAEKAAAVLLKEGIRMSYRAMADTGPLKDRELALRGGLGFIGKNHMLIHPRMGSYVFIGYVWFSEPFAPDRRERAENRCSGCEACLKACPGGALQRDGSFLTDRCRSGITQKSGKLSDEEIQILKKDPLIFGCDVCQKVCPLNEGVTPTPIEAFSKDRIARLDREDLAGLSRRGFREKYPERAFTFRGPAVLLRNLEIVEGK